MLLRYCPPSRLCHSCRPIRHIRRVYHLPRRYRKLHESHRRFRFLRQFLSQKEILFIMFLTVLMVGWGFSGSRVTLWPLSRLWQKLWNDLICVCAAIVLCLVDNIIEAGDCQRIDKCVKRGQPFGNSDWVMQTVRRLCLESTLKPRDPKKVSDPFNSLRNWHNENET